MSERSVKERYWAYRLYLLKQYHDKEHVTKGPIETIRIYRSLIREDETYLSSHKNSSASLNAEIKCGAYLIKKDDKGFYTRIRLKNDKNIHFGIRDLKIYDWKRLEEKQ